MSHILMPATSRLGPGLVHAEAHAVIGEQLQGGVLHPLQLGGRPASRNNLSTSASRRGSDWYCGTGQVRSDWYCCDGSGQVRLVLWNRSDGSDWYCGSVRRVRSGQVRSEGTQGIVWMVGSSLSGAFGTASRVGQHKSDVP